VDIRFRPLTAGDLARVSGWQQRPHVARWWRDPADLASIRSHYQPSIDGRDPTEVFIVVVDGEDAGVIQRYLVSDYPDWEAAVGAGDAAGIDYYLGEPGLVGRGIGTAAISRFARDTLRRYPDAAAVIADPEQANVASWRALEKAGFERVAAGVFEPDGEPAYIYRLARQRWRHPNHRDRRLLPVELWRAPITDAARAWVARATGQPVVAARRLAGASSTAVHGIHLSGGARLVLRRYVWPGFLAAEPLAVQREVDALRYAADHGLAVPEIVAADVSGRDIGDGVPAVLMTWLPGRAVGVPDLGDLARAAATIHDVPADDFGHDYFPWCADTVTGPPRGSSRPALWEAAIEHWHTRVPVYQPTLIHRDFHPGNVVWCRRRLSGVVDWPNACRGPRGCDIATCRANLRDLGGTTAADGFAAAYEAQTGVRHDPFWDLASILESDPADLALLVGVLEPRLDAALRAAQH
jgi:Ser/Thr protein kinase RdoA (MazF antagonist)/RimJ/RimL family protein N-acetyltransferase